MPDGQLVSEIMTLIVAGHETTASTLNWAWYLLSENSAVEEKLSSELDTLAGSDFPDLNDLPKFTYTRNVIEETLRLYPAGWLMTRRALKDDQLGDYFVPAGTEDLYLTLLDSAASRFLASFRSLLSRSVRVQSIAGSAPDDNAPVFSRSAKMHRGILCPGGDADPPNDDRQTSASEVRERTASSTRSRREFAK